MMTDNYGHWDISAIGEFNPDDFFGFIYEIEEIATGRLYVGKKFFRHKRQKTKSNPSRFKDSEWRDYTSSCVPLQEAIEQNGKAQFKFRILSLCAGKSQLTYEEYEVQIVRDVLRARLPDGTHKYYNRNIANKHFAGLEKQTEETKAKMRAAKLGIPKTEEAKKNMSIAQKERFRKNPPNEAQKAALLTYAKTSRTDETRRKMSISAIGNTNGKPHPHTEETKRKIGLLKMGNKNCIGRVISDETKAKMRQKRLEYLAKSRNLPL